MLRPPPAWLLALLASAIVAVVPSAAAQVMTYGQGDVELLLVNPDLEPQADGAVHVGGDFFGQIVLRGPRAAEIVELGFSFGAGPPPPSYAPIIAGLRDFRHDDLAEDGWILPITAGDTPAGSYNFAISAYSRLNDAQSEVARIWGPATLEDSDATPPWPWVLPGETASTGNPYGVTGVTLEFAEEASAKLWVNGEEVPVEPWTPPARDDDNVPRYTDPTTARVLGSGYKWVGEVQRADVLRIAATDDSGNVATKAVLVGFGIDVPVLDVRPTETRLSGSHGDTLVYTLGLANLGLRAAETITAGLRAPAGWGANENRAVPSIPPGGAGTIDLQLHVPPKGPAGLYDFFGVVTWTVGTEVAERIIPLRVELLGGAGPLAGDDAAPDGGEGGDDQGIPGMPALLALAALGVAARRRRWTGR